MFWNVVNEVFGVQRSHAAGAGRRDRLAVDVILNVPAREDAGDAGLRTIVGDDLTVPIELELPAEQ